MSGRITVVGVVGAGTPDDPYRPDTPLRAVWVLGYNLVRMKCVITDSETAAKSEAESGGLSMCLRERSIASGGEVSVILSGATPREMVEFEWEGGLTKPQEQADSAGSIVKKVRMPLSVAKGYGYIKARGLDSGREAKVYVRVD